MKIKEIGKVVTGKTPPTREKRFFNGEYPFITPTDIQDYNVRFLEQTERNLTQAWLLAQPKYLLPPKAICYVCIGSTVGKICMNRIPSFTNQQINSIICDLKKANPFYIFYKLRFETPIIKSIASARGAGKSIMNKTDFENLEVDVADLRIQNKIASILSAYDDLIENNNRRIKILEEMAQTIYNEWFVKFLFPGHSRVKMIDSELGKIPEGWEVKKICEILKYHIGGGWGKDVEEGKYFIPAYVIRGTDIPEVRENNIVNCPLRYHTESNFKSRKIENGDVIFEVSGGSKDQPVGRALLINVANLQSFDHPVICASFCKLMRVNPQLVTPELFYLKLLSIYEDRSIYKYQVQSTGISNFKFEYFLNNEKILIPSEVVKEKFSELIEPIFNAIALFGQKNMKLKESRDIFLPKLISGGINVENLDIKTEDTE